MEKRNGEIIKVAIIGPESTGKSSLSESLANKFLTCYVPEFARNYLTEKNGKYVYDDLEYIAKMQLKQEDLLIKSANQLLICDTNLLVIKIWSEFVFGKVSNFIVESLQHNNYAVTLLTAIDIPWEFDVLREHPHQREELFSLYKKELTSNNIAYHTISGNHETRVKNAVNIIENFKIN